MTQLDRTIVKVALDATQEFAPPAHRAPLGRTTAAVQAAILEFARAAHASRRRVFTPVVPAVAQLGPELVRLVLHAQQATTSQHLAVGHRMLYASLVLVHLILHVAASAAVARQLEPL